MIGNRIVRTLLMVAIAAAAAGCSSKKPEATTGEGKKGEIVVFVAASLRESMDELGKAFEKETGVHVLFNLGGSNELARQIIAAPKADLFLSANENWMDTVEHAGRMVAGTRHDLLSNKLVVVAATASKWKIDSPCVIGTLPYKYLALGDPETVPAGKYAKQWLTSITCDGHPLWESVAKRIAPAPDVRAALGQVMADPDLIGIVYKTDMLAFTDRVRLLYEVNDGPKIRYVLAQMDKGSDPDDARRFAEFLASDKAKQVFEQHGFTMLSSNAPAAQ